MLLLRSANDRTLTHFVAQVQDETIRSALRYYTLEGVLGQLLDARYWTIGPPAASASAGAEFEIRYGDAEQPDAPGGRKQRAHEFDACLAQGGLGVSFIEAI